MVEILIGLISGIISGTGMGGGTILILLLSFFMGIDQHIAQGTNLIFFIPTSIAAVIISLRHKNIDLKVGWIVGGFGIIGAMLGAIVSSKINSYHLRKYFGIFLAIIAIYEIFSWIREYRKSKKKT